MLASFVFLAVVDLALGKARWLVVEWAWERIEREQPEIHVQHPYYHHDLAPNVATDTAAWGPIRYTLRTNSLGFRDRDRREIPGPATAHRIVLIGDSFTEGLGVDFDATFAGVLARGYASKGIEVLNAGVASYSPAIYWKKIEYLLGERRVQIDDVVVFLDMSDIQDEALAYRIDDMGRVVDAPEVRAGLTGLWARNSLTYRAAAKALRTVYPHPPIAGCSIPDTFEVDCRAGWTLSPVLMNQYGGDGLRRADRHMTDLTALLRRHRIPLTLVVYPWPQQLQWNDRSSLQVNYWRQWARREAVPFIDLFESFLGEADLLGTTQAIDRYFIPGDFHWNARGHQFVADRFMQQFTPVPKRALPAD